MRELAKHLTRIPICSNGSSGLMVSRTLRLGLSASACDIHYGADTKLQIEMQPSVFIGILTGPDASGLHVEGHGDIQVRPFLPLVAGFAEQQACIGHHQAGCRFMSLGITITDQALDELIEDYGGGSAGALAQLLKRGTFLRELQRSMELTQFASALVSPSNELDDVDSLRFEGCVLALLSCLNQMLGKSADFRPTLSARDIARVHQVREMLEENLVAPPSLAALSKAAGLNATTLSQHFRTFFGVTIFAYLRRARLEQARHLLNETDLAVSQIAYKVGYANPGAFATAFHRQFGLSPSQTVRPLKTDN